MKAAQKAYMFLGALLLGLVTAFDFFVVEPLANLAARTRAYFKGSRHD